MKMSTKQQQIKTYNRLAELIILGQMVKPHPKDNAVWKALERARRRCGISFEGVER